MSGIKWQSDEDIAELGKRIEIHDEPHKRRFLEIRERLKDRLKGPSYAGVGEADGVGSSDVLEFTGNLEPALAAQLPDTEIFTDKGGVAYAAARGLHHAHRQWMVETGYEEEILKSANQYCLGYAVRARGIGPRKGYESEGIEWPWSEDVPLDQFGWDMRASSFDSAEYAFQLLREFPHDLKARAEKENEGLSDGDPGWWHLDVIELMEEDARKDGKTSMYAVYFPKADGAKIAKEQGLKHPERYRGVQLFLTADAQGKAEFTKIREALPHYGSNPYTVIGMQRIPDESMAVTVLALTIDQADNYNGIVASNSREAKEYRSIAIIGRKKLGEMIQGSRHRHTYWDAAFKKEEVHTLEIGGVTDQQLLQEARAQEIYHRAVGQTEADRGALTPGAKATDLALASAASGARRGGQVNTFHRGIKADLKGIAELLYYTDTVVVDLPPEAAEEGNSVAPVFFGGDFDKKQIQAYYAKHYPHIDLRPEDIEDDGQDVPLTDLQLRLKMGSMGRQSKQEMIAEAYGEMDIAERTTLFLIQNPPIDARKYVRYMAKKTGFAELAEFIDFAWVEFMRAAMLQGMEGPPPAQGEGGSGTLGTGPQAMVLPGGSGGPKQLQPQNTAGPQSGESANQVRQGATAAGMGAL